MVPTLASISFFPDLYLSKITQRAWFSPVSSKELTIKRQGHLLPVLSLTPVVSCLRHLAI